MTWRATPLSDSGDGLYVEVAKSHAKRNCLVIGPAGSGKLSLARGLAALAYPRARKFLFDWQVELEAQQGLLADMAERVSGGIKAPQVWIHREIHRIHGVELACFHRLNRALQAEGATFIKSYATIDSEKELAEESSGLDQSFPVRISLGDGGFLHGAFESVLATALVSLRHKYGKPISSVDPEAVLELEQIASRGRMPTMLSALERAYVLETEPILRVSTLHK